MPRTSDKREKLLEAAKTLIHRQGFYRTTLADIAEESNVPLGNVYYYFKTKEEICDAVIEERWQSMQEMFSCCCQGNGPKQNLIELVKTMMKDSVTIAEHGCAIGSLCQELDKTPSDLSESANKCIKEHINWASKQFKDMGFKEAEDMGVEFVARIQGIMLLGNVLREPKLIKKQLRSTCEWIGSL